MVNLIYKYAHFQLYYFICIFLRIHNKYNRTYYLYTVQIFSLLALCKIYLKYRIKTSHYLINLILILSVGCYLNPNEVSLHFAKLSILLEN